GAPQVWRGCPHELDAASTGSRRRPLNPWAAKNPTPQQVGCPPRDNLTGTTRERRVSAGENYHTGRGRANLEVVRGKQRAKRWNDNEGCTSEEHAHQRSKR